MSPLFIATWGVSLGCSLLLLRGRSVASWCIAEGLMGAAALLMWRGGPQIDPYLAATAFALVRLALFSAFTATRPAEEVRWSPTRAAIAALLVYALLVPAMIRTPIDGDEPFYVLLTESLVGDRDFDLANQYQLMSESVTGRSDLRPQLGDPRGPSGEIYSRHPPLLSFLLIPGLVMAGLPGAIATIAIFAALFVRSTLLLLDDEQVSTATQRLVYPFVAFGPPIVFYAARVWPEAPAAFLFVEALRGVRDRRIQRWLPAISFMVLLKLRFVLIAVPLAAFGFLRDRRQTLRVRASSRARSVLIIASLLLLVAVPMGIAWIVSGNPLNVHAARELLPFAPQLYARGTLGLLVDGAAGLLFHAPFYLLGIAAVMRWRSMPYAFRAGCMCALLYLFYLVPRSEWHGGWAPPLRYIVVFTPLLALGAAHLLERRAARAWLPLIALWTTAVAIHGVAHPWRLFHIANGENVTGEMLSRLFESDFSRLFPSFIRVNNAAWIAAAAVVLALTIIRFTRWAPRTELIAAGAVLVIALGVAAGQRPGKVVQFEDEHVVHRGGSLYPEVYTVARFMYRGGWILRGGDSVSFQVRRGRSRLHYVTDAPATIEVGGRAMQLPVTGVHYTPIAINFEKEGRVEIRCLSGAVNLDYMVHEPD